MSKRESDFIKDTCQKKIVAFETYLSGKPSITLDLSIREKGIDLFTRRRTGFASNLQDGDVRVLSLLLPGLPSAHANILVHSKYLNQPYNWAIFDPNGPDYFKLILLDANKKNITYNFIPITTQNLNYGKDAYNPGYCGVFGIIFILYFKDNYNNPNWVTNWIQFLKCLEEPVESTRIQGSKGVKLAAEVVNEILYKPEFTGNLKTDIKEDKASLSILELIRKTEKELLLDSSAPCNQIKSPTRKSTGGNKSGKIYKKLNKSNKYK